MSSVKEVCCNFYLPTPKATHKVFAEQLGTAAGQGLIEVGEEHDDDASDPLHHLHQLHLLFLHSARQSVLQCREMQDQSYKCRQDYAIQRKQGQICPISSPVTKLLVSSLLMTQVPFCRDKVS